MPVVPRLLYLQLHLLVLVFAGTAILGKLISLPAPALVVWRTVLAAAGAAFLLKIVRRQPLLPRPRQLIGMLGIGAIVGVHWMCFFGAIRLANISICLAGMATISIFTAFTEPWLERRRVRPVEVALGLLVVAGIVLIAGVERGHLAGLGVALIGAFLAAVFPVLNRRLVREGGLSPLTMVAWEMLGAAFICLAALPLFDGYATLWQWRGLDWLWLLLLGWACTVGAHGWHIHLLRHLSAYTANLAINFEPLYGILAAAFLFAEHRDLHPGFYLGATGIIAANVLHPLILRRLARRKNLSPMPPSTSVG